MTQTALGLRLKELRALRGLSLREAAKETGVDRETIRKIELGERRPFLRTLTRLSEGYGVPLRELLELLAKPQVEVPPLALEWMYDASDAERARALDAASAAECERYVAEIDRAIELAESSSGERETEDTRDMMRRYVARMIALRDEANGVRVPAPSLAEVKEVVGA